jgi:hypothetical protein
MSGLDPSPDQARDWLTRELARPEYPHPSLLDRFLSWLADKLGGFVGAATGSGVGLVVSILVAVLVAVVLIAALSRVRRDRTEQPEQVGVLDLPDTADQLRARAEQALADGRADEAVADAARALARRCVERGLLDDAPGRTTHEVFADVAARFADEAPRLRSAADLFDRVVYGRRAATTDQAQGLLALEDSVRRTRPGAPTAAGGLAVPR